jgi:hypothetical protein
VAGATRFGSGAGGAGGATASGGGVGSRPASFFRPSVVSRRAASSPHETAKLASRSSARVVVAVVITAALGGA